jgi:hypothetical protein
MSTPEWMVVDIEIFTNGGDFTGLSPLHVS